MSEESKFERVLGRREVFALSFGAMIGWGWVVLAGLWIQRAGTLGAMAAFVLGGLMILFVGLAYAELTSAMPKCGGEHVFTMRAMGKQGSFLCTWAIIVGYVSVVSFEAVAFPTVLTYLFPNFLQGYMYTVAGFDVYASWVAVAIITSIFITGLNYVGAKPAAILNTVLTFVIAAIGIILIAGSAVSGEVANTQPLISDGMKGIMTVAIMTPFMFVGFDVIPQAAEEINIPFRKIGRVLVFSILMAILWYVVIILAVSLMMTDAEINASTLVTADAMKKAFGNSDLAAQVLVIGGIAGVITSWNSFFIGGSRAMYSLAESKMLPHFLSKLHPRYKTPYGAVLLIGIISCIVPFFGRAMMVWVTDAGSFACVVAYFMVSVSFLMLRKKEPHMARPYFIRHGNVVGSLAVFMSAGMLLLYMPTMPSGLVFEEWVIVAAFAILGAVFYASARFYYGDEFGVHEMFSVINTEEPDEGALYGGAAGAELQPAYVKVHN